MRFEVGCDPESKEFREYWSSNGYSGVLGDVIRSVRNPIQLIIWKESNRIVGHAIWHESDTETHGKGNQPRNKDDSEALQSLLGGNKNFVELHEWWLIEKYRGKGYGNEFLGFFETYMKSRGYLNLVFYADHPAALAAFRKHRYKEGGYVAGSKEYVFCHSLEESHQDKMRKRKQKPQSKT